MRLKSVYISQYKNLRNFSLSFDGGSFIDVFVGKNGSGKSNLFEALIEIFRHLTEFGKDGNAIDFEYAVTYEINGTDIAIEWKADKLRINNNEDRKSLGRTPLPKNVIIYYSGHNDTVADLVEKFEKDFRSRIKRADFGETRYFIGIGPAYKELLLSVLLMQPEISKSRKFIIQKLSIQNVSPDVRLVLERPAYAVDSRFDIEYNDQTDRYWKPEGITKTFLNRLHGCVSSLTNGPVRSEGYFSIEDRYILYINIEKIQQEFVDYTAQDLFRQLDNLKTLGMLSEISITLQLTGEVDATIAHFSDGQFQSVYIYSIVELFKDRHCITLLDEPDSFLHPEWQFVFLKQVFEITDTAAKNNHVLMSSHSASTITTAKESIINLFEFDGSNVAVKKVTKADIIQSLSAGLISFSENEARLNIHHILRNTTGPVLFTEGTTDEMILDTAWSKLYPTEKRKFEIQQGFGCGFLRSFMKDKEVYRKNPGRIFFSIFDFDEAYNEWNQKGAIDIQDDPDCCLVKKFHADCEGYMLLLPVPHESQIRSQVINPRTGGNFGNKSLLTIELLFFGVDGLDSFFSIDNERTDGFIKFVGDKVKFAQDIVPTLHAKSFDVFRPIFAFIQSKCPVP